MATIIQDGPNKGFYQIPNTLSSEKGPSQATSYDASFGQPNLYQAMRSQQLALEDNAGTGQNVYYRYSPGPGKTIVNITNRPPLVDGYYYVRRNDAVDLRQQLYALENNDIPSTGNTEVFNTSLDTVNPPADYCPYYIDPCPPDAAWCLQCKQGHPSVFAPLTPRPNLLGFLEKWMVLFVFVLFLAGIMTFVI